MKRHSTVKEPDNIATSFIRGSARGLRATLLALMLMCVAGAIATTVVAGDNALSRINRQRETGRDVA